MKRIILFINLLFLVACSDSADDNEVTFRSKIKLGNALFHDKNFSLNRTQSCATCHDPEHGFIDSRLDNGTLGHNGLIAAVSLGDDSSSLGRRNTPTAGYAAFTPVFVANKTHDRPDNVTSSTQQSYTGAVGGQFLDGREADLKGQAGVPPLNPVEMSMPDIASVIDRVKEKNDYIDAFKELYGSTIFDTDEDAYAALTESIEQFEKTDIFAPFDSKYDRSLTGDYLLNFKELAGRSLFFSPNMNCSYCHQLKELDETGETFSSYEYHNIGTPANTIVNTANGTTDPDIGLMSNAVFETDPLQKGKFKVPVLRNVAVTEPYMHNGVFRDLKTVIEFYDHFINPVIRANNPETSLPWANAEVLENINTTALNDSKTLNDNQIENLVCFLRLLTDKKLEPLIQDKGIDCGA